MALGRVEGDFVERADAFSATLAARAADEPQNRFQGMPSDGDSRPINAAMGRQGWIGLHWPIELGGHGLSPMHTLAAEERFGYHWLPLSGYLLSVKTIGNALLRFASPELQRSLLPQIAAGELVFCQGFSEPEAGSDLASLRTRAHRHGDRWIVNGHKIWTSSAQLADWIYLAVRSEETRLASRPVGDCRRHAHTGNRGAGDGDAGGRRALRGLPARRRGAGGPDRGRTRLWLGGVDGDPGPRAGHEREARRGAAGDGRPRSAHRGSLGAPRAAALSRRGAGGAAARAVRDQLLADGTPASAAASMAKTSIALLAQRLAGWAVEVLGPQALIERGPRSLLDGRLAALHRASVAATISGGAVEIQRRVIARRRLGCPA